MISPNEPTGGKELKTSEDIMKEIIRLGETKGNYQKHEC